jgi:hypothetical protein
MGRADKPVAGEERERATRHDGLVILSVTLAVLLEVLPVEWDLKVVSLASGSVLGWLAAKSACLGLIVLPLVVYYRRHGRGGLLRVRGCLVAIGAIVAVTFLMDIAQITLMVIHGRWHIGQ